MREDALAFVFPGGKLVQDVDSVTLVNNTALTIDHVVPTGKRWKVLSIKVANNDNVARVFNCIVYKEAAATNYLNRVFAASINSTVQAFWPSGNGALADYTQHGGVWELILDAGNLLRVTWDAGGVSAGAVDADGLVICYLEMNI